MTVEAPDAVEHRGQRHLGERLGRLAQPQGVLGQSGPGAHGGGHVASTQRDEGGNELGLVLGEQLGGLVRHVGHDGPHRPGRQRAVQRSGGGHGQTTQAPGAAQHPGGLASGHGGVVPQPGGHGGGGIEIPQLQCIELAVGHAQLGAEAISRPLAGHQLVPVEAQL